MDASKFDIKSEISVGNFRCLPNIRTVSDGSASKQIDAKKTKSPEELRCLFHFTDIIPNGKARKIHTVTVRTTSLIPYIIYNTAACRAVSR
jgi:hypothetical protein